MKIDFYTKTVLTIIAVSLSVIAYRNIEFIPSVNAHPMNFASQTPLDVKIVSIPFEGLNVNVKNKVEVKPSSYKGLDVNVTNHKDFK